MVKSFSKKSIALCFSFFLILPLHLAFSHGDGGHSDTPSSIAKDIIDKENELRLSKTGQEFEVVLSIELTDSPLWTIYISDPNSNRPIKDASVTILLNKKDSIVVKNSSKVGIYQGNIHKKGVDSISIMIEKENIKENFVFDNLKFPLEKKKYSLITILVYISIFILIIILISLKVYYFRNRIKMPKDRSIIPLLILLNITSPFFPSSNCWAHGDEEHNHQDHDEDKKTQPSNSSSDDGHHSVTNKQNEITVPKEIQFQLGIVTDKVAERDLKETRRLVGQIVSDPSGYARLQATQNARVIITPEYPLPLPGQKVKKDEVILVLQPTLNKIETSVEKTALYKIESEIFQLEKDVNRKEKLGIYVTKKDLENTKSDLDRAKKQKEEILNKTFKPEYLKSPIDGIVSDLHVRSGEIVTQEKIIVEIVDPTKYLIEAFVFDPKISESITGGIARLPLFADTSIPLQILGISPKVSKEDQATHILFKPERIDPTIKVDMAVEILADLTSNKSVLAIPRKAIVEERNNAWVFIHTSPETFEKRKVRIRRTIEDWSEIEEGLSMNEKVVVEGAYLLNQEKR